MKKLKSLVKPPPRSPCKTRTNGKTLADILNEWVRSIPNTKSATMNEHVEFIMRGLRSSYKSNFGGPQHYQVWRVRASGQICTRQEYYKRLGLCDPSDTAAQAKFFLGHFYEDYVKSLMLLAGMKVHSFNSRVTIPIYGTCDLCDGDDECRCGEIDCLYERGGRTWLVDVKSSSGFSFPWISDDYAKKWGYDKQQRTYMMSNELEGKVEGAILLFVNKDTGADFKQVLVPPPKERHKREWFRHTKLLAGNRIPDRPDWADIRKSHLRKPKKTVEVFTDKRCGYCDAKEHCWGKGWYEREEGGSQWVRDV